MLSLPVEMIRLQGMTAQSRFQASDAKKSVLADLCILLEGRFADFNKGIYSTMGVFYPKNWSDEREYGNAAVEELSTHFEVNLKVSGFDKFKVLGEWRMVRNFTKVWLKNKDTVELWRYILSFKRNEFPNNSALVEIYVCLSGCNSSIERAFSTLTNTLSDRRLSTKQSRMESILLIKTNDKNWSPAEREEIIARAAEIYTERRRKRRVPEVAEPPKKVRILESESQTRSKDVITIDVNNSSDDSSSSKSSCESDESKYSDDDNF